MNQSTQANRWQMRDFTEWDRAAHDGDALSLINLMRRAIRRWPFEGDPTRTSSSERLSPAQFQQAGMEVRAYIVATFTRQTVGQVRAEQAREQGARHD